MASYITQVPAHHRHTLDENGIITWTHRELRAHLRNQHDMGGSDWVVKEGSERHMLREHLHSHDEADGRA